MPLTKPRNANSQKPIYPKPSLTERLIEWINELMYRLAGAGASLPGGWFTLTIL